MQYIHSHLSETLVKIKFIVNRFFLFAVMLEMMVLYDYPNRFSSFRSIISVLHHLGC